MMAKMFYRFDEARQVLGMSDEQLKQLTREGKLREFRDGTQIMYKADQVDQLRGELGLGDPHSIDLGPSDTGLGLGDTRTEGGSGLGNTIGGSLTGTSGGSVISLADTSSKDDTATDLALSGSGSGSGMPLSPSSSGTAIPLSSTGTGNAINLSNTGSATGIPLSGTASGIPLSGTASGVPLSGGTRAGSSLPPRTGSGVSVLGADEGGTADPAAATALGGSFGGEPQLDAMGSGSGLLDLSREQDDTSLGAPVLDEISAGSRGIGGSSIGSLASAPTITPTASSAAARAGSVPVYVEATDNFTPLAAGLAGGASILVLAAVYAVFAGAMSVQPSLLSFLYSGTGNTRAAFPMLYVLGIGLLLAAIFGVVGFLVGRKK